MPRMYPATVRWQIAEAGAVPAHAPGLVLQASGVARRLERTLRLAVGAVLVNEEGGKSKPMISAGV